MKRIKNKTTTQVVQRILGKLKKTNYSEKRGLWKSLLKDIISKEKLTEFELFEISFYLRKYFDEDLDKENRETQAKLLLYEYIECFVKVYLSFNYTEGRK